MNILLMADLVANPDQGAAGTGYQTVQALRQLGHDVDTLWADELPHRVQHGNLHYLVELPIAYRLALLARLRQKRYDAVQVDQPHGYLAASTLRKLGVRPAFIHRSHGFEPRVAHELKKWQKIYSGDDARPSLRVIASRMLATLLERHNKAIARYADGHVVSASECAHFLIEHFNVAPEKIAVIPQAAPQAYLDRPALPMTPARRKRLLYVGQLAFFKAPMVVAAAINRMMELDSELQATWVTSKSSHDQVASLLSEAARCRTTLRGWMPQEQLLDIYDEHGIFIFPSFFEGFGKVFLEAMARGLCVVAACNGGARDVIRHGTDGLLVDTGDAAALVEQCLALVRNPDKSLGIALAARKRAEAYTWHRVAQETAAFYHRLISAF